jgi:hypothetical protein
MWGKGMLYKSHYQILTNTLVLKPVTLSQKIAL